MASALAEALQGPAAPAEAAGPETRPIPAAAAPRDGLRPPAAGSRTAPRHATARLRGTLAAGFGAADSGRACRPGAPPIRSSSGGARSTGRRWPAGSAALVLGLLSPSRPPARCRSRDIRPSSPPAGSPQDSCRRFCSSVAVGLQLTRSGHRYRSLLYGVAAGAGVFALVDSLRVYSFTQANHGGAYDSALAHTNGDPPRLVSLIVVLVAMAGAMRAAARPRSRLGAGLLALAAGGRGGRSRRAGRHRACDPGVTPAPARVRGAARVSVAARAAAGLRRHDPPGAGAGRQRHRERLRAHRRGLSAERVRYPMAMVSDLGLIAAAVILLLASRKPAEDVLPPSPPPPPAPPQPLWRPPYGWPPPVASSPLRRVVSSWRPSDRKARARAGGR